MNLKRLNDLKLRRFILLFIAFMFSMFGVVMFGGDFSDMTSSGSGKSILFFMPIIIASFPWLVLFGETGAPSFGALLISLLFIVLTLNYHKKTLKYDVELKSFIGPLKPVREMTEENIAASKRFTKYILVLVLTIIFAFLFAKYYW